MGITKQIKPEHNVISDLDCATYFCQQATNYLFTQCRHSVAVSGQLFVLEFVRLFSDRRPQPFELASIRVVCIVNYKQSMCLAGIFK